LPVRRRAILISFFLMKPQAMSICALKNISKRVWRYCAREERWIVVAHRLSSILTANKIFYFDNGTLIAEGTHQELYKMLPAYKTLVDQQFPAGRKVHA